MRKRTVWLVLSLLLFPLQARAHEHSAEAFLGGSGESGSFLRGSHAWVDWQKGPKQFSMLLDLATHAGDHEGSARTRTSFAAGGRYSARRDPNAIVVPSFHALIGGRIAKQGRGTHRLNGLAVVGAGFDFLRPKQPQDRVQVGLRLQGDCLLSSSNDKDERHAWRGSIGLVVRFLSHHDH